MKKTDTKCHIYYATFAFDIANKEEVTVQLGSCDNVIKVSPRDIEPGEALQIYDIFFYVPDNRLFTDVYFSIFCDFCDAYNATLLDILPQFRASQLLGMTFKNLSYLVPVWSDGSFYLNDYISAVKKGKGNEKRKF